MAKTTFTSIFDSPIPVQFENFQELEATIDAFRELLETTDRGRFSVIASLYDDLLKIREQALRDFISSAESRLTYTSYKVTDDNTSSTIVSNRRKGEAA
jgi:hypothetical protein